MLSFEINGLMGSVPAPRRESDREEFLLFQDPLAEAGNDVSPVMDSK